MAISSKHQVVPKLRKFANLVGTVTIWSGLCSPMHDRGRPYMTMRNFMLIFLDDPQRHVRNEIEDQSGDHIQPNERVRDYVEGFSWHVKLLTMRTV